MRRGPIGVATQVRDILLQQLYAFLPPRPAPALRVGDNRQNACVALHSWQRPGWRHITDTAQYVRLRGAPHRLFRRRPGVGQCGTACYCQSYPLTAQVSRERTPVRVDGSRRQRGEERLLLAVRWLLPYAGGHAACTAPSKDGVPSAVEASAASSAELQIRSCRTQCWLHWEKAAEQASPSNERVASALPPQPRQRAPGPHEVEYSDGTVN